MHSASSCQGCGVIYNFPSSPVCICLTQSGFFYFFLCSTDFRLFEGWLTEGYVWSCCLSHDKCFSLPETLIWAKSGWDSLDSAAVARHGSGWLKLVVWSRAKMFNNMVKRKKMNWNTCVHKEGLGHWDVASLRFLHVSQWVSFNLVYGQLTPPKPMLLFLSDKHQSHCHLSQLFSK